MMAMEKMKHKQYTDTHHSNSGLKYWLLCMEVKMMQAMNVSSVFRIPGNVERKPMCSPCGRSLARNTSPTYTNKQTHDKTEAPI